MKVHTCRNARVFGHSHVFPSRLCVCQLHWGSCSSSLIFAPAPQWSRCLRSQPPAPWQRPEPRRLLPSPPPPFRCQHAYTHTHLHKLHLLSGAALDEAAEGDRVFMRESVCVCVGGGEKESGKDLRLMCTSEP